MKALLFLLNSTYSDHKNIEENPEYEYIINNSVRGAGIYIAAHKFREQGIDAEVVDFLSAWTEDELVTFLENKKDDNIKFVGISANFASYLYITEFIKKLELYFPDAIKIVGGQRRFNQDLNADYYVSGFSEVALPALLKHELYGDELIYTPNFKGKLIETKTGKYQTHLLPDYQTYYKDTDYITPADVLSLEIGRGCKFSCDFCSFSLIGLKHRTVRDSKNIRDELVRNYELYGVTNYILSDDTTNETTDRIRKLAEAVDGLDFNPTFAGFVRLDLISAHKDQIELLAQSRILSHYYGVETFNRATGKTIGKGADPNRLKDTMLEIYEYTMKTIGEYHGDTGMIIGLPHESIESVNQSYEWLKKYWSGVGQNVIWFPLLMEEDGVIYSKIFKNYEKYGYTIDSVNDAWGTGSPRPQLKLLQWKNEHMSLDYASTTLYGKYTQHWWDTGRPKSFGEAILVRALYGNMNSSTLGSHNTSSFLGDKTIEIEKYKRRKLAPYDYKR